MASKPDLPRILVTGASGQVGGELLQTLAPLGTVIAPTRAEMDLSSIISVQDAIRSVRPHWIVNAGAYTAVDKAESEQGLAFAINAEAVRVIGMEARALDAGVIHFSTDYVFDGQSSRPYFETDPTNPINVYGASKLAGEQALQQSGAAALIFRTSWVYGAAGKNFLRTILKLARERQELRIVDDQHGAPTWSRDLARMAAHAIAHCERLTPGAATQFTGTYHAAGSGETTWAGFATEAIHQLQKHEPSTRFATIVPISTADYPTPAKRPANSLLNGEKLSETFGWQMMEWKESLRQVLAKVG